MKSQILTFTARETVELRPQETNPAPLSAGEIAGRTLVSLTSPGTEMAAFSGDAFPAHPGYAAIFQVDEIGAHVQDFRVGDLALSMGPHASLQRCEARDATLLPPGLSPERAAFARLMGVSMSALATTQARPPSRVVITGLGIIGNLAAQIFRRCGYRVLACDPSEARRELAEQCGLETREKVPLGDANWQDRTALIVECSGHENAVLDACNLVKTGGEVVMVGVPWQKRSDASAHEILRAVFFRYVVLRSGWEWQVSRHEAPFANTSIAQNLEGAMQWLHENRVRVDELAQVFAPADCQAAYESLLVASNSHLTALFDWR